MSKKNLIIIFIVNLILIMNCFGRVTVLADEMVGFRGKHMCKSGKYVYYIRTWGYETPGLVKYNIETGKKKVIVKLKLNGEKTGYLYTNLYTSGDYLYCVWDIANPKYGENCKAIYRFSKDGKEKKLLAYGENMVLKNKRLHYDKLKVIKDGSKKYTQEYKKRKRYSMKLDGSDKKKEETVYYSQMCSEKQIGGLVYDDVKTSKYTYYVEEADKIYKKNNRTGKTKKIVQLKKDCEIVYFCVSKEYIFYISYNFNKSRSYRCLIKNNGKNKVLLEKSM